MQMLFLLNLIYIIRKCTPMSISRTDLTVDAQVKSQDPENTPTVWMKQLTLSTPTLTCLHPRFVSAIVSYVRANPRAPSIFVLAENVPLPVSFRWYNVTNCDCALGQFT